MHKGFRSKFTSTEERRLSARSGSVSSRRVDAYCSKRRGRHDHWASRRRQRTPPRRRHRRVILEHGRWWSRNARRLRKRLDSTLCPIKLNLDFHHFFFSSSSSPFFFLFHSYSLTSWLLLQGFPKIRNCSSPHWDCWFRSCFRWWWSNNLEGTVKSREDIVSYIPPFPSIERSLDFVDSC